MKRNSGNIRNLDQLEKEIYRLKFRSSQLEDKMDNQFDYLQHNYGTLIKNSIFGHRSEPQSENAGFAQSFMHNSRIKTAVDKVVEFLAHRLADGIESVIDKISKK